MKEFQDVIQRKVDAWSAWAGYLFDCGYIEEAFDLWDEAATMAVACNL